MDIRLAEVNVRVEAPEPVLAILEAMLSVIPRSAGGGSPDVVISAERNDDVWEIRGPDGSLKMLAGRTALPRIGGAIVSSAIHGSATWRNVTPMRAAVIERDGRALAMIGDDWESAVTLAAHLHGRGWRFIGSDNALLDRATLEVLPVQKSLYVNSSSISQFPTCYRGAIETSPWYVTPQGISFYAVDPRNAGQTQTWAQSAVLAGVVIVDGAVADRPSIESPGSAMLRSERFARLGIDWKRVRAGELRLGRCIPTCDLLDHWFEASPA